MTEKATKDDFLRRVGVYLKQTGMSENALARWALDIEGSHGYFNRVRDMDKTTLKSINRVDAFMHKNPGGFIPSK